MIPSGKAYSLDGLIVYSMKKMNVLRSFFVLLSFLTMALSCKEPIRQIQPVPFTDIHFHDEFWLPRMEINRTVSIPSAFGKSEETGRFDNFALAGGLMEGEHQGDFPFDDTDPYKIIEGASYSLALKYDAKLDAYLDSVISLIAAAQEDDGYLTTCVTNNCTRLSRWWGSQRWERINSHELYNSGHLYEAAVAHYQATGKRSLLDVAIKNADLVCRDFGLGEGQISYPSGHPIIEMALVKLYKVTGNENYLTTARYFIDEAGRGSGGRPLNAYSQDHMPILEQTEIVGHAVRAGYLFSGVTDVAALQQDRELFAAVERIWENMASRKLYLNGGIGSRAQGEGFGPNYELNNFNNYCETCASIANVYWNHRMFLASGHAKYIDVLERTLYNGVVSGVSLSGDRFFYDNPMASNGEHERQEWFGCACCPGNVTRFMASVPAYVYAVEGNTAFVNLYVQSEGSVQLKATKLDIKQTTAYPWEGDVELTVDPETSSRFELKLRIPGWVQNQPVPTDLYHYADSLQPRVSVMLNDKAIEMDVVDGYVSISRKWKKGDRIGLHMDMPIRRVAANEKVEYNRGLLAIERGPVLYGIEGIDQADPFVFNLVIPADAKLTTRYDASFLGGVQLIEGEAMQKDKGVVSFKAIPYATWNNRGRSKWVVWTPTSADKAIAQPEPTIASKARQIGGWGLNDQFEPRSSADLNTPYHYWWLKAGTDEEVAYAFEREEWVSGVEVYWLEFDHYDVSYRVPSSWKLYYQSGKDWKEVEATSPYGVAVDQYNKLTFKPVKTTGLKIVASLRKGDQEQLGTESGPQTVELRDKAYSGGIIEWKVIGL